MHISIASDHGGWKLKEKIKEHLLENDSLDVTDCGTFDESSCDYPDYGIKAAVLVASNECDLGIAVCTTGEGMTMVCNKVKGIRCALALNCDMAEFSKLHNNANMLALGAKYVTDVEAFEIVDTFLNTPFSNELRHEKRVNKIMELEEK